MKNSNIKAGKMKNSNKKAVMILVIIAIIAIVTFIYYLKNGNENGVTEKEIKCIASKSTLFVSKTCGVCAEQKRILEEYIDDFEIIECTSNIEICRENEITRVPTWRINGENHLGLKTIKKLKELTGC